MESPDMRTADKIVRIDAAGSAIEGAEKRLREVLAAQIEGHAAAIAGDVARLSMRHDENAAVAAGHADRIAKLEAALSAAGAVKNRPTWFRRLPHARGAAIGLTVAIGSAATWHWWAPLAAICGAVWRAATGAP
jgi:hypothetical protein